jgi:putative glutamine amidotransferase
MRRPQIGIPLTLDHRARWRKGRAYHYIDRSYADAVDRAGGMPLQLPIQSDPSTLVEAIDGLLIPGGEDFPVDAELPEDAELDLVSPEQLAFDEALFDAASRRRIPVLGICYGMQLMARARGGRLDGHLPSQRPDADEHRLPPEGRHAISIDSESRLACILGSNACNVNSLHRQAVRRVGPGHRVAATSRDGIIEAIEAPEIWELGVQWHPEKMIEESSERIFRAFIDACREGSIDFAERAS